MNASQIDQTSKFILQYFPHLNLADLKVFFDKMKLGHFGKFYDSVDGQLILSKMEEYNQERMNEFEQIRFIQHKEEIKNNPIGEGYHPDVIEAMKKAIGEKEIGKMSENYNRELTKSEITAKRWMKQFDNLHGKYGVPHVSSRFIKIGNKVMDFTEFMNRKFENATK